jgi:hypothetical protein
MGKILMVMQRTYALFGIREFQHRSGAARQSNTRGNPQMPVEWGRTLSLREWQIFEKNPGAAPCALLRSD